MHSYIDGGVQYFNDYHLQPMSDEQSGVAYIGFVQHVDDTREVEAIPESEAPFKMVIRDGNADVLHPSTNEVLIVFNNVPVTLVKGFAQAVLVLDEKFVVCSISIENEVDRSSIQSKE